MPAPGDAFPRLKLPSSKGGTTDLGEAFDKGAVVLAVLDGPERDAWLAVVAERHLDWLMYAFVNVYLVVAATPAEARALADEHGIQAPFLCADAQALPEPGFYRVEGGLVAARVGLDEPADALARLSVG